MNGMKNQFPCPPPEPAAPVTHPAFRWIERERGRRP